MLAFILLSIALLALDEGGAAQRPVPPACALHSSRAFGASDSGHGRGHPCDAGTDARFSILTPYESEGEMFDSRFEALRAEQITPDSGVSYLARLEFGQGLPSDSGTGSVCILREDGVVLGPAHADIDHIRGTGRGAFSHWTFADLYFSASDNSNPRTNGRSYTLDCTRRLVVRKAVLATSDPRATYKLAASGTEVENRRLVIRNRDASTAVQAKLLARGTPDLSSREGMLNSILVPGMTAEDKSIAIWRLLSEQVYNWHPAQDDGEIHDPVKLINVYGYGYCDDLAESFASLSEAAGIPARIWHLSGHIVAESFYDDGWHMFDADFGLYFRAADGHILGVEELAIDPTPVIESAFPGLAPLYSTMDDNFVLARQAFLPPHRVEPVLEPGDRVVFDLGPARIIHRPYFPDKPLPPLAGNGTLTRTISVAGDPSEGLILVEWPYTLVGGSFNGKGEVAISADGLQWTEARQFDSWFAEKEEATYRFTLRVRNPGRTLTLTLNFQFAPLSVPALGPGTTIFDLEVKPVGIAFPREWAGVEVTHEWEDRATPLSQ